MSLTRLETAKVNFIYLQIKVKHDKMVSFSARMCIPCQDQDNNHGSHIRFFV